MKFWFSFITSASVSLLILPDSIEGHGHMYSPRSRNFVAYEDGIDAWENSESGTEGVPVREHCYYCLNTKAANEVCGVGGAQSYDDWVDADGNPIPWNSQATYTEGDIIEIKSNLHTPHWGHQDVMICPDGNDSTQECFEAHPLEFVEDVSYGAPKDPNYPTRGHFTGAHVDFTMKFKLPLGVTGDKVMMQWRYVTANNCWPPGYENYEYDQAKGGNSLTCTYPLDPTGAVGTGKPEQFWNCAEITILPDSPTPPPVPTAPTVTPPTPPPTLAPVAAPTEPACCSWPPYEQCSQPENTWCQSSKSNCEGSCSGKWLGGAPPPTNAPVAAPTSPVAPTAPSPVSPPTNAGRGCCSINFKTCHHPVGTFCWETEENCRGPCGKYWLPTGEVDGCSAQWDACSNDDDCCGPATCGSDGTCAADGWNYTPSPTTSAPVSSPTTPAPVPVTASPVTSSPTSSPSIVPTMGKSVTSAPVTSSPTASPSVEPTNGEVSTMSPSLGPTEQPLLCKKWCEGASATWPQKCKWKACNGCPACPTQSPTSSPTKSQVTSSPTKLISTSSPTSSPIDSPTNIPTKAPVLSPTTNNPTISDGTDSCCTWDLYHCGVDGWCNESEDNCQAACGGVWMKKTSKAMQCLAKYQECDGDIDICCDSLTCQGDSKYKQCL